MGQNFFPHLYKICKLKDCRWLLTFLQGKLAFYRIICGVNRFNDMEAIVKKDIFNFQMQRTGLFIRIMAQLGLASSLLELLS